MPIYVPGTLGLDWQGARAKIRSDLWRPGTGIPDDQCDRALHAALLELESEARWLWLEQITDTFTMLLAADNIPLSSIVGSISSLAHISGASKNLLTPQPLAAMRELAVNSPGAPSFYALGDRTVFFDTIVPYLDAFEIVFTAQTPELLNDAIDTPNIALERQEQAVIALACHHVALTFLKNEAEAMRQRGAYDRILQSLFTRESTQRGDLYGAGIQPDSGYHVAAHGYEGMR